MNLSSEILDTSLLFILLSVGYVHQTQLVLSVDWQLFLSGWTISL